MRPRVMALFFQLLGTLPEGRQARLAQTYCASLEGLLRAVESTRDARYPALRASGVCSLLYERQLYSSFYLREVQAAGCGPADRTLQQELYDSCRRLNSRLCLVKGRFSRRFYVDFMDVVEVRYLALAFEKGSGRNKLRVVVSEVRQDGERVLADHSFNESTWVQLTRLPYQPEAEFLRQEG